MFTPYTRSLWKARDMPKDGMVTSGYGGEDTWQIRGHPVYLPVNTQ